MKLQAKRGGSLFDVAFGACILGHSGALDGLRESSSEVIDFRLLGEGLEGEDFFFTK